MKLIKENSQILNLLSLLDNKLRDYEIASNIFYVMSFTRTQESNRPTGGAHIDDGRMSTV